MFIEQIWLSFLLLASFTRVFRCQLVIYIVRERGRESDREAGRGTERKVERVA